MKTTKTRKPLCIGARARLTSCHNKAVKRGSQSNAYVVWDTRIPSQPQGWPVMSAKDVRVVSKHQIYACLPDNKRMRQMANDYGWELLARITNTGVVLLKGQRAPKPKPRLSLKKPANVTGPVLPKSQPRHPRVTQLPPAPGYNSPVVHI